MGWQAGKGGGAGAGPDRDPGVLSWFARDADGRDALVPSGLLALAAEQASGPERRCPGASDDELVGLLRGWAAIESWAAAGKLGVIAELIRRDDQPLKGGTRQDRGHHGDLPDEWSPSLAHELALALACSVQSAQTTAWLAWELKARLPGTGALLHGGTLTLAKARAVIETFQCLTDADAAAAEALILGQLPGKTYPQVLRLAEQAALTVDPELAERRRAETARRHARVTFFRELAGTAGLSGRDLPPDEALAAMAAVNARAQEYEDSGAFGDAPMDALRAYAYLDLLTGTPAAARIACAVAQDEAADVAEALAWANARAARNAAQAKPGDNPGCAPEPAPEPGAGPEDGDATQAPVGPALADPDDPAAGHGDSHRPSDRDSGDDPGYDDDPGDDGDCGDDGDLGGDGRPGGGKPGGGSPGSASPGPGGPGSARPGSDGACPAGPSAAGPGSGATGASTTGRTLQPRLPDLVVPLLTLLGLAERPGEVQGFGLLDPALALSLAAAAITSPRTEVCVTVTNPEGHATGHGCARRERRSRRVTQPGARGASPAVLPARLNLTIPATALAGLVGPAGGAGAWGFVPCPGAGPPGAADPPDGYGSWALTLPGGQHFTVRLDAVPLESCDHRYEARGYHPGAKLRHLVQVRDGTCTFPSCSRHARDSDFEHAVPFEKGGRTCACNAGARSRACHRVKQTKKWQVTQPRPGWHQWRTPSGRVYTQSPKRYPA